MQLILYVLAIVASMTITAFTPEEIALYKDLFKGLEQFVSQEDFENALKQNLASRIAANYILMLKEEIPNIKTSDDITTQYAAALKFFNYPTWPGSPSQESLKSLFNSREKEILENIPEEKIITELTVAAFPVVEKIPTESRAILENNKQLIAQEIRKQITKAKKILVKGIDEGKSKSILSMSQLSKENDKSRNPAFKALIDIQYRSKFSELYKDSTTGLKKLFDKELPLRKKFYTNSSQDLLDRTPFEQSLRAKNIQTFIDLAIYKLYRQGRASTPEKLGLTQEQFDSVMTIGKLIDESLDRMIRNYVIPAVLVGHKRILGDTIQQSYQIIQADYARGVNLVYKRLSRLYDQEDILQNPEIIKRKKRIGAKKERLADAKLLLSNLEIVKTESPAFAELAQKKIDEINGILGQDAQADIGKEEEFYKNPTLDQLEKNTQLQASINVAMNSATKKIEATLNALKAIARSVNNPEEREKLAEILEELNADEIESKLILQEAPKFSTKKADDPKSEKEDPAETTVKKEPEAATPGSTEAKKDDSGEPQKEATTPEEKPAPQDTPEKDNPKPDVKPEKKEKPEPSTGPSSPDLSGNLVDFLTDLANAFFLLNYKLKN